MTTATVEITAPEEQRYAELQQLALDFARRGEVGELEGMLNAGLPVNLADHKGNTLLMLACYHGNLETAQILLQHGAEVDRRNDRSQTPLGGAAFKGDTAVVDLLLRHGADINADNGNGMTPILFAALFGRTAVVEQLRAHESQVGSSLRFRSFASVLVRISSWIAHRFRPHKTSKHAHSFC